VRTAVGDRYVVDAMRKGGYNLAESSRAPDLLDHASTGDGLIGALQVLALMIRTGRPLSELAREAMERVLSARERHARGQEAARGHAALQKLVDHVKASLARTAACSSLERHRAQAARHVEGPTRAASARWRASSSRRRGKTWAESVYRKPGPSLDLRRLCPVRRRSIAVPQRR